MLGKSSKNILPNGGFLWGFTMVESILKKSPEKQIQGKVSFENQTG